MKATEQTVELPTPTPAKQIGNFVRRVILGFARAYSKSECLQNVFYILVRFWIQIPCGLSLRFDAQCYFHC